MSTKVSQFLMLALAMSTTAWAHAQLPHSTRAESDEMFVPSPQTVRLLNFGFDALMSDSYWLQAIQIVGGTDVLEPSDADQLGQLVDVVTTLNPHVGHPYRFAAIWLTHDERQVREGIRLLERSIEYHPEDWRNYFYIGFNHFFYLAEFEEAARVLEQAIHLPGRPAYLPRLVARLKSQHGDIDVAEVFLRELLRSTEDEDTRAKLEAALDEIEIEYKARHLDKARAAYRERMGRDLEQIEDLVRGPGRVLERLPSPEPDGMPAEYRRGSVWRIDSKTGEIVSSYLGKRYEVHFSGTDRKRIEAFHEANAASSPSAATPETNAASSPSAATQTSTGGVKGDG